MKILIIGTIASGKTTLAKKLEQKLNIKYYEIDSIVHDDENQVRRTPDEQKEIIKEIDKQSDWIIEGVLRENLNYLLDMCDKIIYLNMPLILVILAIIPVVETISVMLQVVYFRLTKKRLFKMAPLHHHLELTGWRETKVVGILSLITLVFSVISVLGAYFFGVPILQILTGVSLIKYKFAFIILMCSGGLNALSYFGYYILTIMRKSNSIIGGYVVASIVAKVANDFFVVKYGIIGAAYGFLSSVAVLFTIFYVSIVINLIKKFEKHILMKV